MAKRQVSDRNRQAALNRKAQESPDTFTTNNGRVIRLKKPDMMFLQQVSGSVEYPEKPTYEVKVGSKTRSYPLDTLVIKQTEDPVERARLRGIWVEYNEAYGKALQDSTVRTTAAVFYEGTEIEEIDDPQWEKKMRITRMPVPTDPEELWVFYLQTSLTEEEIQRLTTKIILKAGGVSEDKIAAAESMFLDGVPSDDGSGDMEELDADARGDTAEGAE